MKYLMLLLVVWVCGTCAPAKEAKTDTKVQDGISEFVQEKD